MIEKAHKALFFLIVFFTSAQIGFHFWPSFSYVNGIRIDYLSPTLHLLDILIAGLFILFAASLIPKKNKIRITPKNVTLRLLLGVFIFSLSLNILLAKSPEVHMFGIIKIFEFGFLGFYTANTFSKKDILPFINTICISAIVSSFLAILQFLNQSSIGGLWYFLGERTFNISTIGISTVNFDSQVLRAYAAFPHPNVLAFFLIFAIAASFPKLVREKKLWKKIFLSLSVLISSVALIMTFSRIATILLVCFLFYTIYTKGKRNLLYPGAVLTVAVVIILYLLFPQFLLRGIDLRQDLFIESYKMLSGNLYFGIGLNNFFIHQAEYIKTISPTLFQPVHNIFVLALLSLGIFAFWIFPAIFIAAFHSLRGKIQNTFSKDPEAGDFYKSVLFLLGSVVVAGMFDHFFLTLEQGQIMLALILGLSFSNIKG